MSNSNTQLNSPPSHSAHTMKISPSIIAFLLATAAATVGAQGPPECAAFCPMDYDPVCGSDGVTYGNPCGLEVARCNNPSLAITQAAAGECPPAPAPTPVSSTPASITPKVTRSCIACTRIYSPVCGTDGTTYANACMLRRAKCKNPKLASLGIQSIGACQ